MKWAEADAAFAAHLSAALGGAKILLGDAFWGETFPGPYTDDLFFGALDLGVRDSALRIEVRVVHGAAVHFDAWLARRTTGHESYVNVTLDPAINAIEIERPSELVVELIRDLANTWLATASDAALVLDGTVLWRPLARDRHWYVRTIDFDAHLSQLLGEPLGALSLLGPAPLR